MTVTLHLTPQSPLYPPGLQRAQPSASQLFIASEHWEDLLTRPAVAIVGSRKASTYGREITHKIVTELARAGVAIVSGMAIGIDSIAHKATLQAGGQTIAVLPSGLDNPYPARHQGLAREIVAQGGALLTEYPESTIPYPVNFIARNRIVAALADVVLVTEATHKSGTLHTARFALEQGKDVAAVPGDITKPTSQGTNELLKAGAALVTGAADITHILGIQLQPRAQPQSQDSQEQAILDLLSKGVSDGAELLESSGLNVAAFNHALTMLEITNAIRALGNNRWSLT